jgi:UDP-N-acetylglucosamine transferase subunit ALG13
MEKLSIFVTTGNSSYNFDRMLNLVEDFLTQLPESCEVLLQYGHSSERSFSKTTKSSSFLSRQEAENAYRNSDLIFSHCGIGSIFNSLKYNRPTVIIPRYKKHNEFSDDHQLQIAKEIKNNKLLFLAEDGEADTKSFKQFIDEMISSDKKEINLVNYKLADFIKSRLYG